MNNQTVFISKNNIKKKWYLVDASEDSLGRISTKIAAILRGKHKPSFTPNMDCGDNVIVINSDKVKLTGNKLQQKKYIRHTGYPGGQRETKVTELISKGYSERIIFSAVRGMLPKNKLSRAILKNIRVFKDEKHNLDAQKPEKINF